VYLWPLPKHFTRGDETLSVSPDLSLSLQGVSHNSSIVQDAFERYRDLIFKPWAHAGPTSEYEVSTLTVLVSSDDETVRASSILEYSCIVNVIGVFD
jgi:beta-acetyl hexosaminidase like